MKVYIVIDTFSDKTMGIHGIYINKENAAKEIMRDDVEADGFYMLEYETED